MRFVAFNKELFMYTQPEVSRMAKVLARESAKMGAKITHSQAMQLVARIHGDRNLETHQVRGRTKLNLELLAREHAASQLFSSYGRYGAHIENVFDEIDAAYQLESSRDVEHALHQVFDSVGAPVLREHVSAQYRYDQLREVFARLKADALRLADRALYEARALQADEPTVLYQGPMLDWRIQEGTPIEELDAAAQRRFEARVTRNGSQFYFDIAPAHAHPDEVEGKDQLSLFIEINEGRPCVHATNDMYGDQAVTLFGAGHGTYVRFNVDSDQVSCPDDEFARQVGCTTGFLLAPADA